MDGSERQWAGKWGAHIRPFEEYLREQGYARSTAWGHLQAVHRFGRWGDGQALDVSKLGEQQIKEFANCPEGTCRGDGDIRGARCFVRYLRVAGIVSIAPAALEKGGAFEQVMADYKQYLLGERALHPHSLENYLRPVAQFVRERFGEQVPWTLHEIGAEDLSGFMCRHAYEQSLAWAKMMATALRSFVSFLHLRGDLDANLSQSVPSVAYWRLSTLPRWIAREQVEQLLSSCERQSPVGRRNYAILLLLARLGLRAMEVAGLRLEDIDWQAGEILIQGKTGRFEKLPLPSDVGEALVSYLRHGRPRSATRQVFLSAKAPRRPLSANAISIMTRNKMVHSRIQAPRTGAHVLRHSLATDMLNHGASLAEIGQVLRHQHIQTTALYAKVDLARLHSLAKPWPGGAL